MPPYAAFSSASFPLPTNVRGSGRARCWTSSPTGSDARRCARARGARRARRSPSAPFGIHADEERALRLRPGCGIGLARSHRGIMPRYAPCGDRARRPSRRADARARRHPVAERARGGRSASTSSASSRRAWTLEFAGDEAFLLRAASTRRACRSSCSRRTTTPCPRRATSRDGSSGDAVHGLGASDMKGGLAVALELARDDRPARPDRATSALLLFGREELPAEHNPLPALFAGSRARPRGRRSRSCSSRPT